MKNMKKSILSLVGCILLCVGCDLETVPATTYTSNLTSSRFKVVSSVYYRLESPDPNLTVTVFTDTQGSNDFVVVNSIHGLSTLPISHIAVSAENNK